MPFVSTRTRAEVQAEVMANRERLTAAASEWTLQHETAQPMSAYTREEARTAYEAAREEVRALTSEDSGSSYLARQAARANADLIMARSAR